MADISSLFASPAMPTEYFQIQSQYVNDKKLYDSVITEAYNKFGVPMVYYVVDYDKNYDKIFGEDMDRVIERKFNCMAYYELQEEIEMFTKWGIEGIDNFHLYISKSHLEIASTYNIDGTMSGSTSGEGTYPSYTPKRGDIIRSVYNDRWYEIVNIQQEQEQFLQTKHSWDLIVKIRKDEHMTVSDALSADGISDITDIQNDIYNLSGAVELEKPDIIYAPGPGERAVDDPFNGW
jgi:hypothetical protein